MLVTALAVGALSAAVTVADAATSRRHSPARAAPHPPRRLAGTGLYSDFASRIVDPRNRPYTPQYPLWSDGAGKHRWIYLPPGTAIDARDPEAWVFPIGTRFWKEFAWSRRVETRFLERTRAGWMYATYVWADDGSDAVLAPEAGVLSTYEVAPGIRHQIPGVADCKICHRSGRTEILGFGALQLSSDRDPLAPHAEPLSPDDLTLEALVRRGLLRGFPRALLDPPPRIHAATPRGRAAMGYLHGNCGGCHDSVGALASLGLTLRHSLRARDQASEPAAAAIGHASDYQVPGAPPGQTEWIRPGDPALSAVVARMASRDPVAQMPPLATQLVDEEAVALLRRWISEDLRPSQRAPQHGSAAGHESRRHE